MRWATCRRQRYKGSVGMCSLDWGVVPQWRWRWVGETGVMCNCTQQLPHLPWFLTGLTAPLVRQSTLGGAADTSSSDTSGEPMCRTSCARGPRRASAAVATPLQEQGRQH